MLSIECSNFDVENRGIIQGLDSGPHTCKKTHERLDDTTNKSSREIVCLGELRQRCVIHMGSQLQPENCFVAQYVLPVETTMVWLCCFMAFVFSMAHGQSRE